MYDLYILNVLKTNKNVRKEHILLHNFVMLKTARDVQDGGRRGRH